MGMTTDIGSDWVTIDGIRYRRKIRFYAVNLVRSAVAADTFTASMQIDPGTPFFCTSFHADDTADTNALGTQEAWGVQAQDNEGGYLWSDNLTERSAFFGDRILGYQLPYEMPIRANTRIQWTVRNRAAGVTAGTATIVLRGFSLVQA
jgi:hypothetical protein